MAIGDISLTSSTRANLLSLQSTAKLLGTTQERLSTGKKINSALDNATSYFQSQGFLNTANDLSTLKDSMATALQTIQAASDAIESISDLVTQLQSIVTSAAQTTDASTRASLSNTYDALLGQLDDLANDATFNGTNLVNSISSSLKIDFNTTNTTSLTVTGQNLKTAGLGIGASVGDWASNAQAKQVSGSYTVGAATDLAQATTVYTGAINDIELATGTVVLDATTATITSNSTDFASGTTVDNGTSTVAADMVGIRTALLAAGLTEDSGPTAETMTETSVASFTIKGQFTVEGGSDAASFSNAGVLVAGAASTVTIGAGQTIEFTITDGDSTDTYVFTNETASDVSINLAADFEATMSDSNNSATANLDATSVGADATYLAGLSLTNTGTLNGNSLQDLTGLAEGATFTGYVTSDGTGLTVGTTTSGASTVYDATTATVSGITKTDIVASFSTTGGTTAMSFDGAAAGVHVGLTDVAQASATSTTTVVSNALTMAQSQLTSALAALRSASSALGTNNSLVQARQEFTSNLINTLQTASDNLVLADTNEEGANMQTLQAQNQLGIVSLSISGQLAQSVLKLF